MNTPTIFSIIRVIVYLWVGIEFGNLAFLYLVGYKNYKTTPIIKSLRTMFLFLSILFIFYSFIPVFYDFDKEKHAILVQFLPLVIIPVGLAVREFREESLRRQEMRLPDGKKNKKDGK